jgi:hypothetical protein
MEIALSKGYTIFTVALIGVLILGSWKHIEYWILIVPAMFIIEFPLHELTHSIVARHYGFKVSSIELTLGKGTCHVKREVDVNILHVANVCISGYLFSIFCMATTAIFLILVGISQHSIYPVMFALTIIFIELGNTYINETCDVRRYVNLRNQHDKGLQKQYIQSDQ